MEAEIVETNKLLEKTGETEVVVRNEQGKFIPGHPPTGGRPVGSKNKFTLVKEALVDAFLDGEGPEAFKNTLIYEDLAGADGKKKKLINLEALRSVLRVLPREDLSSGNTYNFNLIVGELKALGPDQLRAIIAAGKSHVGIGGGEGPSAL